MAQGEITPLASPDLADSTVGFATGTGFSIYYWDSEHKRGLGEFLEYTAQHAPPTNRSTATSEMHDGVQAIRVEFSGPRYSEKFWLDPDRGYSLLEHLVTNTGLDGTTRLMVREQVTKLARVALNVWFPVEASSDIEPSQKRRVYTGSNVVANDDRFDESVFSIVFPPGTAINDKISGTLYRIAPPAADVQKRLDQLAVDADTIGDDTIVGHHRHRRWIVITVLCIALIVSALAITFYLRKRGRGGGRPGALAGLLLICLMGSNVPTVCCGKAVPSTRPSTITDHTLRLNCGVNCGYLSLRLYGRAASLESVAASLKAGDHWENECSMFDLRNLLTSHSLTATGLKAQNVRELIKLADSGSLLILRLSKTSGHTDLNHFIILRRARGGYALMDPPAKSRFLSKATAYEDEELATATGEALVIRESSEYRGHASVSLPLGEQQDVGVVPQSTKEVTVKFRLKNRGDKPLKILSVDGPCACFLGWTLEPKEIAPGLEGALTFRFNKALLPSGVIERNVNVATNDPAHELLRFVTKMDVKGPPTIFETHLSPQIIDLGRGFSESFESSYVVQLVIPKTAAHGLRGVKPTFDPKKFSVVQVAVPGDGNDASPMIINYNVRLREVPKDGPFEEIVEFSLVGGANDGLVLELPIRGDSIRVINKK